MVQGTQASIILIVIVLLVLVYWNKKNSEAVDKYNGSWEKDFQKKAMPYITQMRTKGYSEETIQRSIDQLRKKIIKSNEAPEVRDLNRIVEDPDGFLKDTFVK